MSDINKMNSTFSSFINDGTKGNFECISSLKANDLIEVRKYKSTKTGLTVAIGQVEGPIVSGYFALATETFDDDGLPHTLEHLIFLGSEDYPYKGVLDLLANRNLASGTNAHTDTDNTVYTLTTAGHEGFLALMPIYIDHILYPTLTDAAYVTEVHHVTGEGTDAGVVYCEMQGRENTGDSICFLEMLRFAYPGKCGYSSETGGILHNLRTSTSNLKCREFHKEFYRPENFTLIITGQVDDAEVLKALEPVEDKILSKGERGPFLRPWEQPVPELKESKTLTIPYPSDTEDNGMVFVAWRGPSAVTELYEFGACSILLRYLTDTSISPLQKYFVEVDDPLASTVSYSLCENAQSLLYVKFENVPMEKLQAVKGELRKVLGMMEDGSEPFSLSRMRTVVHRQKLETLQNMETSPHDAVAFMLIGDMLYGYTEDDLNQRLNPVVDLEKMAEEPEEFWKGLLKKYLIDGPWISIIGQPSLYELERRAKEEESREAKQKEALGPEGLAAKAKTLKDALRQNEIPPPVEMLTLLPVPDAGKIQFHTVQSFSSDNAQQHEALDTNTVPVYMYLDNIKTNFVYLFVAMNTKCLTPALRQYLPLFLEALLESPIQRGDVLVPYEDVVAELEADTIGAEVRIGVQSSGRFSCGSYSQSASLLLQVEPAKYSRAIKWLNELLYATKFTKDRLKVLATKMINDVAQVKKKGHSVSHFLTKDLWYGADSNVHQSSVMRQHKFLASVVDKLELKTEPCEVLEDFEAMRVLLTAPANIFVHMAGNLQPLKAKLGDIETPWKQLLPGDHKPVRVSMSVCPDHALFTPNKLKPACAVGMGSVESAYLNQTVPCIKDFLHPDLPALLVCLQYLTQLEGPMWKQIRGPGLTYSYNIMTKVNEGLMYLMLYRSTDLVGAYREALAIIKNHLGLTADQLDQNLLDSAKSSMIFEIIELEKCIGDVVGQSVMSYFKDVDHNYNKSLVRDVSKVVAEDVVRVGQKYLQPLISPVGSKLSVVCHPAKVNEVAATFKALHYDIAVYKTLEDSFLNEP